MAENSKIEWTHHTFNPWIGCTKVHTGCAHCYAEEMMDHRYGKAKWGPQGTRVRTSDANWRKPLAWDRAAAKAGERHRVFCASLADVFEDWKGPIVDSRGETLHRGKDWGSSKAYITTHLQIGKSVVTLDDLRRDLFRLIDATPNLDWLLLTKRPENVLRMWPHRAGPWIKDGKACVESWRRDNVWIGTSVSDQMTAESIVPAMADIRPLVPVMFLSAEPLVGDLGAEFVRRTLCQQCDDGLVDVTGDGGLDFFGPNCQHCDGTGHFINWLIVGGESGIGRRPMDLAWARSLRDQCEESGVPFFIKQIDKVQEIPDDLMVRQFPAVRTAAAV